MERGTLHTKPRGHSTRGTQRKMYSPKYLRYQSSKMENKDDDKVVILRSLVKVQQIKPKGNRKRKI